MNLDCIKNNFAIKGAIQWSCLKILKTKSKFLKSASKMTEQALIGLSILEIIALNSGQKINKNKTNNKQTNKLPIGTGE